MTNEQAKKMLKAKLECFKNETSGINYDCNMRLCDGCSLNYEQGNMGEQKEALDMAIKALEQTSWILVSERLPEDLEAVNIIWVNHEPEPYYHEIKDKNFIATGIHFRGKWYWYSTTCADYLGEYGENEFDMVDDAIEIIAWMPLPQPYKAESEDEECKEQTISNLKKLKSFHNGSYGADINRAIQALEQQPKMGEWIEILVTNCTAEHKCSECGRILETYHDYGKFDIDDLYEQYPYCHCGAKMGGDKDDE